VLEVPAGQLDALAADAEVTAVAANAIVTSHMALTTSTTGADAALNGLVSTLGAVNGSGVGVAIIDSGIAAHRALSGKIVANVDFTRDGRGRGRDGYGHGTHIAGIVAGDAISAKKGEGAAGMAPGAHLINLRVLGNDGSGQVADVIEALDWAIENRGQFNIRVINMSLGTAVTQSYKDDPLGQAVERAVKAGIVVVASAGNRGDGRRQDGARQRDLPATRPTSSRRRVRATARPTAR
jgi:serine protease AprX